MSIITRFHRFLWLLLFCIFAGSCAAPPAGNSQPQAKSMEPQAGTRGGTLVYRLTSEPTTCNYQLAADESSILLSLYLLQSRLIDFDHRSQTYVPSLADSWQLGADGVTVDVKMREDAKFSDGRPITAEDVVFTFQAVYDERTKSPLLRDALSVGGKPIKATAADKFRVQLVFPEKVASVENYLVNLAVLPAHILKSELDSGKIAEAWKITADPKTIVTSGPFAVESTVAGERITLARNPHFWKKDASGTQLPYLDKLVLETIKDPNNTLAKLGQNAIDIADRIRPADYASLTPAQGSVKGVDAGPGLGIDHFWFNLNRSKQSGEKLDDKPKFRWFNDKRFRRAVSFAIDRLSIASATLRGLATPVYGVVSPANRMWANPNLQKTEYDLEKSRQLLIEAGFTLRGTAESLELLDADGNRVEFTLLVPAENEPRKLMATVIQEDLARLGIKMQVVPIEFQAVTAAWSKTFDYDAVLVGLSATDIEPSSYSNFFPSTASTHQWQPGQKTPATEWEAKIDKLFAAQSRESEHEKRKAMFYEIQDIMADEMPVIPIMSRHIVSAANTRIGNYAPSSILPYSLWNAEKLFIIP